MYKLEAIELVYNTVKFMRRKQIKSRIIYQLRKKTSRTILVLEADNIKNNFTYYDPMVINTLKNSSEIVVDFQKVNDLYNKKFTFLNNLSFEFQGEIDWNANPFDYRLWNFNLNYFDFLNDFSYAYLIDRDIKWVEKGTEYILDWWHTNKSHYNSNLWDPYVVAKRIFNISLFFSVLEESSREKYKKEYGNIIKTHVNFLEKNIEEYLGANHLVMDGKGLVFGGVFLNDVSIIKTGVNLLKRELQEQVLESGMHYEMSSSYHIEVLMHFMEVGIVLNRNGFQDEGKYFIDHIHKMFECLYEFMMPNSEIPLINDSTLDYPIQASNILECGSLLYSDSKYLKYCPEKTGVYTYMLFGTEGIKRLEEMRGNPMNYEGLSVHEHGGYYIIKDSLEGIGGLYLLFDCGSCGPEYNLGHTHADSLNVILTLGEKKVFVDTGTYTYQISKERDYLRSTAAHNTLCIDGTSSSQVWKAFRTAKRAYTHITKYDQSENYVHISAEHDGYTKTLKGSKLFHRRTVIYFKNIGIIFVDRVYGRFEKMHNLEVNYYLGQEIDQINSRGIKFRNSNTIVKTNFDIKIKDSKGAEQFNIHKMLKNLKSITTVGSEATYITVVDLYGDKINISDNGSIININAIDTSYEYDTKLEKVYEINKENGW
ncbi:alginate lyase family protein [Bacillus sp. LB(2018)]|uniref:alginate lyase family protein n=1 Tax=Bacillus sp. LB(2018) TaxID=2293324 RepID=UPI000E2F56E0|nr:alginate lyase family protein [Bacillus cereus]RFB22124.1 hypothetical protein DZB85_21415 [Bacillus sp. LB(2018)]